MWHFGSKSSSSFGDRSWLPRRRAGFDCSAAKSWACFSSTDLNSPSDCISSSFCRKSMSAKIVANVRPVSIAFFVPFYEHTAWDKKLAPYRQCVCACVCVWLLLCLRVMCLPNECTSDKVWWHCHRSQKTRIHTNGSYTVRWRHIHRWMCERERWWRCFFVT